MTDEGAAGRFAASTDWRCRLGLHRRRGGCACVRCGQEQHRLDTRIEWRPEEGIDTSYGIWWRYQEVGTEITYCRRCGASLATSSTVHYRGHP